LLAVAAALRAPALEGRGRRGRRLDAAVVTAAAVVVTGRVVVAGRVVVGQVVVAAAGGRVVAGDAVHAALAAGDGGVHRLQGHLDHLVAEVELAVTEAAVVGGAGPGPAVAAPVVVEVVAVELEGLEAVPGVRPLGAVPARVVDVLPADAPALVVDRVLLDEGPDGLLHLPELLHVDVERVVEVVVVARAEGVGADVVLAHLVGGPGRAAGARRA